MYEPVRPTSFEYHREFLKVESPKPLSRSLLRGYSKYKYKKDFEKHCPIKDVWITTLSRIIKNSTK